MAPTLPEFWVQFPLGPHPSLTCMHSSWYSKALTPSNGNMLSYGFPPSCLAKKSQPGLKQKKIYAVNRKALMFPPIKPLDGPKQRIQLAHMHCIKELSSQVWDLQQQLSGATTENKLLRQLQNATWWHCSASKTHKMAFHGFIGTLRTLSPLCFPFSVNEGP